MKTEEIIDINKELISNITHYINLADSDGSDKLISSLIMHIMDNPNMELRTILPNKFWDKYDYIFSDIRNINRHSLVDSEEKKTLMNKYDMSYIDELPSIDIDYINNWINYNSPRSIRERGLASLLK